MNQSKKKTKAFTLIELLVVIAIIGILTTIVLVSMAATKASAKDSAIKSSMITIRTAAALQYDTSSSYNSVCVAHTGALSTLSSSGDFGRIASAVALQSNVPTGPECLASPVGTSTYYVAWSPLVKESTKFFCVDSSGAAKVTSVEPAVGNYTCP